MPAHTVSCGIRPIYGICDTPAKFFLKNDPTVVFALFKS